jgi:hypothetical protein
MTTSVKTATAADGASWDKGFHIYGLEWTEQGYV